MLPRLPPGVDPEDPEVREIASRLQQANPEVAGTRAILLSKQDLQREYDGMKRDRADLKKLKERADRLGAESGRATAQIQEAEADLSRARGKLNYAKHALGEYWHENDPTRTKAEYEARASELAGLSAEQWEELRSLKEPLLGPARLLRPVGRALAVLTNSPEGWSKVKLWFADSDWCRRHGIEVDVEEEHEDEEHEEGSQSAASGQEAEPGAGAPGVVGSTAGARAHGVAGSTAGATARQKRAPQFRARLVHEVQRQHLSPYVVGQSSSRLDEAQRLLYGDPQLRPDSEEVLRLPAAAQAVIGFLRALHAHALAAAPAYRLWMAYTSARTGVGLYSGSTLRAIEEAGALADRARQAGEEARAAQQALEHRERGLSRWARECGEAREIVRAYHGDDGLIEVDADMTPQGFSVPESVLPRVQRTGVRARENEYVPALREEDRAEMVAARAGVLRDLEGERRRAEDRRVREFDSQSEALLAGRGEGRGPRAGMVLVRDSDSGWWYWFDPIAGDTVWASRREVEGAVGATTVGGSSGKEGAQLDEDEVRELKEMARRALREGKEAAEAVAAAGGAAAAVPVSELARSRAAIRARRGKDKNGTRDDGGGGGGRGPPRGRAALAGERLARRVAHESKVAEAVAVMRLDPAELDQGRILRERGERRMEQEVLEPDEGEQWGLPGAVRLGAGGLQDEAGPGLEDEDEHRRTRRRDVGGLMRISGPGMERLKPLG